MVSAIHTVVYRALAKCFRSTFFYSAVQQAVNNCVTVPHSVDTVTTSMMNVSAFTVLVAKFIQHKSEKGFVEKAKIEDGFNKLTEAAAEKKIKMVDWIPTKDVDTARSPRPLTNISNDKNTSPGAYGTTMFLEASDASRYTTRLQKRKTRLHRSDRRHRSPKPQTHTRYHLIPA